MPSWKSHIRVLTRLFLFCSDAQEEFESEPLSIRRFPLVAILYWNEFGRYCDEEMRLDNPDRELLKEELGW